MNSTMLIPVFLEQFNGRYEQMVDARKLHHFLEVGRHYQSWISERIETYAFVENEDFLISQNGEIKSGRGGDRRSIEYHITLDMAKELAMVERNEKGKQARRYFIQCEARLREQKPSLLSRRFMLWFDDEGQEQVKLLKETDTVLSWADVPKRIRAGDSWLGAELLGDIAQACVEQMQKNAKVLKAENEKLMLKAIAKVIRRDSPGVDSGG